MSTTLDTTQGDHNGRGAGPQTPWPDEAGRRDCHARRPGRLGLLGRRTRPPPRQLLPRRSRTWPPGTCPTAPTTSTPATRSPCRRSLQEPVPDERRREPVRPQDLDRNTKNAAMVVGHPMGAVKEQSANLYATKMAEQGFVTLSLDLSFWGESDGQPRNAGRPRHLHRGLQRRGRLPAHPVLRRHRTHRRARNLRQRQLRHQRRQDRPAHQGRRHGQHVRHGRRQPQRAAPLGHPRAAQGDPRASRSTARRRVRRRRHRIHRRHARKLDRPVDADRARVLRLLPHGAGQQPEHHHPADADAATSSS